MVQQVAIEIADVLEPHVVDAIAHLVERVTELDGVRPLSEHVTIALMAPAAGNFRHLCAWLDTRLVGYAALDLGGDAADPTVELAVDGPVREDGIGGQLLDLAISQTSGRIDMWAHGDFPAAGALAASRGFARDRTLYRMRRSLLRELPSAPIPAGIHIDSFRPEDIFELTDVNRRAFTDLPDQGSLTVSDIKLRMDQSWFDPAGLLIARTDSAIMAGFHWTKVHINDDPFGGATSIGEIYVLAVAPEFSGVGLGRALSVRGLEHLKSQGIADVMLYVDASNVGAFKLYERLGFTKYDTDTLYRSPVPNRPM